MARKKTRTIEYEEVDHQGRAKISSVRQITSSYRGKKTLEFNIDDFSRKESLVIKNNAIRHHTS